MNTIKKIYHINAPIEQVWKALIDPVYIDKWGAGPCEMDDQVGTNFKLWDGEIHGTNLEVEPTKKLVQEWYSTDSPLPTKVTFTLYEEKNGTKIELLHEDIDESKYKELDKGWDDYYLTPMKDFLEL